MKMTMARGVVIFLGALFVSACEGGGDGGEGGSGGNGGGSDPHEASHVACVDKINALRSTKGLPALTRWKEAEACVDQQASEDAMTGTAHGAWSSGKYDCPGCDFYGQATGDTCGHYVNMSAKYVTRVACGFSAEGGWDAINFD